MAGVVATKFSVVLRAPSQALDCASGGDGEFARVGDFGGPIEDGAEVHEGVRRAGRTLAVGIADVVAVEAKDGMVQRDDGVLHSCGHGVWSCR